jgi:hypothetical protein
MPYADTCQQITGNRRIKCHVKNEKKGSNNGKSQRRPTIVIEADIDPVDTATEMAKSK